MAVTFTKDRKKQLNSVAQRLFKERGYAGTSMRDLANALGIEAPSLYNHVSSKENILQDICFDIADQFLAVIEKVEEIEQPEEQLRAAIRQHVFVITQNLDASAVFLNEWRYLSEPHLGNFKALRKKYENFFQGIIQNGIDQDIFRKEDTKFATVTTLSVLNWVYNWYKPRGKMKPEQIAEKLSNLLINGLRKFNPLKTI